jgi:uncharacterized protein YbjT (DUF2867 family)
MHLIVGATGSLGGTIARLLRERGAGVRALVRPASPARTSTRHTPPEQLAAWGVELVEGDLRRPETLAAAVAGSASVVATASGTKRAPPDTVAAVDVAGMEALASAATGAGVGRFLLVSTVGAHPDHPAPLFAAKGRAEAAVRGSGVPFTVLQPAKYLQDWVGFLIGAQLAATAQAPSVDLVGRGDVATTFVDEGDVARVAVAALTDADAANTTVPLAASSASYVDLVHSVAERLGRPVAVRHLGPEEEVGTVPPEIAGTITALLRLQAASPPDTTTTPEAFARFGVAPKTLDAFLDEMVRT